MIFANKNFLEIGGDQLKDCVYKIAKARESRWRNGPGEQGNSLRNAHEAARRYYGWSA